MKTVLITGASRGIGRAAALKFAQMGYNVAINCNKNIELAEQLCTELKSLGVKAGVYPCDVSKSDDVQKMIESVICDFGGIDVLVNNAGIALPQGLFTDFSAQDASRVFDANVFGMMNCARAVIPHFVSKKYGKIVNVSSVWGICGASCEVIYSASKAAVIGFTKALSSELAPSGICVNCVAPGFIETDMNAHLSPEEVREFEANVPLGRIGKAEEVAESIFFLASQGSDYITGQVLSIDGGIA